MVSSQLATYLGGGGAVYLTGERPCCEALNDSIELLLRDVLVDQDVSIGDMGDIGGPFTFNSLAKDGITLVPNVLLDFVPQSPGALAGLAGVGSANSFASNGSVTVGAVWNESDMKAGTGRVALLMDIDWLGSNDRTPIVQNIENFLTSGRSCSADGGQAEIIWSPSSPANCTTVLIPRVLSWTATASTQPAVAVQPVGATADCSTTHPSGTSTTITCAVSATAATGSLVITATTATVSTSRSYRLAPKNDPRNVPIPFSLESDWWTWPDNDDDGLPNHWEQQGVWVKGDFLDLPGWGAHS